MSSQSAYRSLMFIAQTYSETWFDLEAQPHRTQVSGVFANGARLICDNNYRDRLVIAFRAHPIDRLKRSVP